MGNPPTVRQILIDFVVGASLGHVNIFFVQHSDLQLETKIKNDIIPHPQADGETVSPKDGQLRGLRSDMDGLIDFAYVFHDGLLSFGYKNRPFRRTVWKDMLNCGRIGRGDDMGNQQIYIDYFSAPSFFQQRIVSVNGFAQSFRKLKTKHLMSRLNKSTLDDHFDILLIKHYLVYPKYMDLVVVPFLPRGGQQICDHSFTMSELKVDTGGSIRWAMQQLLSSPKCHVTRIDNTHTFRLLPGACVLRAVTYKDMDYGAPWGNFALGGNLFGDTSDFYIVGAVTTGD